MCSPPTYPVRPKPQMVLGETWNFAWSIFCSNKIRFVLTALGMVIGTASLILVVTIGRTGKEYIVRQIQAIGANMIYVSYQGEKVGAGAAQADYLTMDDMNAVQQRVSGIIAASPMAELHDRIIVAGGHERDILVLGVSPQYRRVRNLAVVAGRYFDQQDQMARNKVAVITEKTAIELYGSSDAAIGQTLKVKGIPFVIIGAFKERAETFGQSEIADDTILISYNVARDLTGNDSVKQLFFSVGDAGDVPAATARIKEVIQSRHRPDSLYEVDNLSQLLAVADKSANALTVVLLLISLITLLVSGIGIMNIMLATVGARIREIGIRRAIGATKREIRQQFMAEAIFISLSGGIVGTIIGLGLPISARILTDFRIPIDGLSVIIALTVSSLVGVIFGTVPATRASNLDPVESLRHE